MISICVQGEKLARSIRGIDKSNVSSALQIAEQVLDCLPMSWARVAGKAREHSNSIGDVRMGANGYVQQSANCTDVGLVLHEGKVFRTARRHRSQKLDTKIHTSGDSIRKNRMY
jgi:hypothetical protein